MTLSSDGEMSDADSVLRDALASACSRLAADQRPPTALREEDLRSAIYEELNIRLPGHVRKERKLTLAAFQGVGAIDLIVDADPGGKAAWTGETKWSYTSRNKIYEAAWDAIKLVLVSAEWGVGRSFLIVGAPETAWSNSECADLFRTGEVDVRDLWSRPLIPPGANGGATVGEDVLEGGHGNFFTRAPEQLSIEAVTEEKLAQKRGEPWLIRAAAVAAAGGWIEDFAPPPDFPAVIDQSWLTANVAGLSSAQFDRLIARLRKKRWTEEELRERVYPLRHD